MIRSSDVHRILFVLFTVLLFSSVRAAEKRKDKRELEDEYTSIRNIDKIADVGTLNRLESGGHGIQLPELDQIRKENRSVQEDIQWTIEMVRGGRRGRMRPTSLKKTELSKNIYIEKADYGEEGHITVRIREANLYAQEFLSHIKVQQTAGLAQEYKYGRALMSPVQVDPVVSFEIEWADETSAGADGSLPPYSRVIKETRISSTRGAYTTQRIQKPVSVTRYRDGSVLVRYDDGTSLLVRKNRLSKKNPRRIQISTEESVKADGRIFLFKRYTDNTQEVLRENQEIVSPQPKPEKPPSDEN